MVKVPPCEMEAEQRKHMRRTYVAKVSAASEPEMLRSLQLQCQSLLFSYKANAYALVDVPMGICAGTYLVLTLPQAREEKSFATSLSKDISGLPLCAAPMWVKPLTRKLQRHFRWGDSAASKEHFMEVCANGDLEEAKSIIPQFAEHLEAAGPSGAIELWNLLHAGAPALADCQHDFEEIECSNYKDVWHPRLRKTLTCLKDRPGGGVGHAGPFFE